MKTLWERSFEIANLIGLILGAVGLMIVGKRPGMKSVLEMSVAAFVIFSVLLIISTILLFRDINNSHIFIDAWNDITRLFK